jgi:type I restriction enzyme S subunit
MINNEAKTREWTTASLEDENSFEFLNGLWTGKKPPFSKAIVIRNTNFSNNGRIDHSKIAVLDVETKQLEKRTLQNHDIIIERSGGGPKQPVGRVVLFEQTTNDMPYSFSNFTSVIRVIDKNKFDPRFVFYYLHSFYGEGKTDELQRRTTGIRNLDFNSYKNSINFPDFNIDEQKKISKILTTAQDAIAGQEELIEKLKKLKKSMMQHLFTHGTKNEPTKMTEIGEIPESWEVKTLEEVAEKPKYGFTDSASKRGNVRFLRITDIQENGVDWDKVPFCNCANPKNYLLKDKDIVFARIGATTGKSYLLRNPDNAVFASYLILVRPKEINSVFLYYYFQTKAYWSQIDSQKKNNLKGGVNGSILSKLLVPSVSVDEEQKLSDILESIDQKIEPAQAKLLAYQKLFKTLLHELMSGERRTL